MQIIIIFLFAAVTPTRSTTSADRQVDLIEKMMGLYRQTETDLDQLTQYMSVCQNLGSSRPTGACELLEKLGKLLSRFIVRVSRIEEFLNQLFTAGLTKLNNPSTPSEDRLEISELCLTTTEAMVKALGGISSAMSTILSDTKFAKSEEAIQVAKQADVILERSQEADAIHKLAGEINQTVINEIIAEATKAHEAKKAAAEPVIESPPAPVLAEKEPAAVAAPAATVNENGKMPTEAAEEEDVVLAKMKMIIELLNEIPEDQEISPRIANLKKMVDLSRTQWIKHNPNKRM